MTDVIRRLPETVSSPRGVFLPSVVARERGDGSWEGCLEFAAVGADTASGYITDVETHQHDRVSLERWASGLTRVYAEGALARARAADPSTPASELMMALQEMIETLDRTIPIIERASEPTIAEDAKRLRADAVHRIAASAGRWPLVTGVKPLTTLIRAGAR